MAATLQYNVGTVFNAVIFGSTPGASPPWMTATFDDGGGSGSVTLELSISSGLDPAAFVSEWDFNLDPSLNPASLIFSGPVKVGSFDVDPVGLGTNAYMADGDGLYDINITFGTSGAGGGIHRFAAGERATYTITGIASLTANSFDFVSASGGGNGPFNTAAHIQGVTAPDGSTVTSVWTSTPEPSTAVLALFGGIAVGGRCFWLRSRRRAGR